MWTHLWLLVTMETGDLVVVATLFIVISCADFFTSFRVRHRKASSMFACVRWLCTKHSLIEVPSTNSRVWFEVSASVPLGRDFIGISCERLLVRSSSSCFFRAARSNRAFYSMLCTGEWNGMFIVSQCCWLLCWSCWLSLTYEINWKPLLRKYERSVRTEGLTVVPF
jgi:hypothetical protein